MFHNGNMKDNLNFKKICPWLQKEQRTEIDFRYEITFYRGSNKITPPVMEEYPLYSIKAALQNVGERSKICHYWEIIKLLKIMHNTKVYWFMLFNNNKVHDITLVSILNCVACIFKSMVPANWCLVDIRVSISL